MSQSDTDWKNKYKESAATLERKERSWSKRESTLKRCISRLSFVGDGLDGELDEKLEDVRNRVRREQDLDQLLRLIEIIVGRAEKLEKGTSVSESAEQGGIDLVAYLLRWLDSLPFPKSQRKQADKLKKALSSQGLSEAVAGDYERLLIDSLAQISSETQNQNKLGSLSRLFAKSGPDDDNATGLSSELSPQDTNAAGVPGVSLLVFLLDLIAELDEQRDQFFSLIDQVNGVQSETELEQLLRDNVSLFRFKGDSKLTADHALLELVERLDISPLLRPQAKALVSQLQKGITRENLPAIIDEVIGLFSNAQKRAEEERQEVERFLHKLTQQLQALDVQLEGVSSDGQAIFDNSRTFADKVQAHVDDVNSTVNGAVEFDELKLAVADQLQVLQERLREHRDKEEERIAGFEERIDQLKAQLSEMESYSEELQESVAKARAEAFKDALTGLNNRHAFDLKLKEEYQRWHRYGSPMSLIVVDVDHFKSVNDRFGHLAGDKVLQVIGKLLKSGTRDVDFPARYGGEEFVVLLPETDLKSAYRVAEKIRRMVEEKPFHSGETRVQVTISAGISEFKQGDGRKEPFARADEALYRAKREGRNRCYAE